MNDNRLLTDEKMKKENETILLHLEHQNNVMLKILHRLENDSADC